MKKWTLWAGGLLLALGVAACQATTPTVSPPAVMSTAVPPTATATTLPPTATPKSALPHGGATTAPTATPGVAQSPAVTRPKSNAASPTPTRPWQIPELEAGDWTTGGDDAGMVLVEYSDFQ